MTFRRTQVKYKATRTSRITYYSLLIGDCIVAMFISIGRDVHVRSVSRGGVVARLQTNEYEWCNQEVTCLGSAQAGCRLRFLSHIESKRSLGRTFSLSHAPHKFYQTIPLRR